MKKTSFMVIEIDTYNTSETSLFIISSISPLPDKRRYVILITNVLLLLLIHLNDFCFVVSCFPLMYPRNVSIRAFTNIFIPYIEKDP